jgi:uncharacterized membrane protein
METPAWALLLSFWVHMLATVVWIGGLAALTILILPIASRTLDEKAYARFLGTVHRRLEPLGWISLGVLTATGLIQTVDNENYTGLLSFTNNWARAMLLKHIFFAGMVGVSAYITWRITPALRHAALLKARNKDAGEEARLEGRRAALLRVNLLLGIAVLVFTALARIS